MCVGASAGGRCVLVQGGVDLEVAGARGGSVASGGVLVLCEVGARGFLRLHSLSTRKGGGGPICLAVELEGGVFGTLQGFVEPLLISFWGVGFL